MADRTGCMLTLGGLVPSAKAERLAEAIRAQDPYRPTGSVTTDRILSELALGAREWEFDEVAEGRRHPDLSRVLVEIAVAWTWSRNWSDEFDPGIEMHDPRCGETVSFAANSGGPVLTSEEALHRPDRVAAARARAGFEDSLRFAVYDSQHRRAGLLAADPSFASLA